VCPTRNSNNSTPRDHQSTRWSCPTPRITSGAKYLFASQTKPITNHHRRAERTGLACLFKAVLCNSLMAASATVHMYCDAGSHNSSTVSAHSKSIMYKQRALRFRIADSCSHKGCLCIPTTALLYVCSVQARCAIVCMCNYLLVPTGEYSLSPLFTGLNDSPSPSSLYCSSPPPLPLPVAVAAVPLPLLLYCCSCCCCCCCCCVRSGGSCCCCCCCCAPCAVLCVSKEGPD
jgi:hypothetical protein